MALDFVITNGDKNVWTQVLQALLQALQVQLQKAQVVIMSIDVTLSETYDLRTQLNKMTLIGIHTPKKDLIMKTYPGLVMNSRYCRIKGIDVVLSAVSNLPVSPDQVGAGADQIAPQDMLNPILYKAVSNDSMSVLEMRLHGLNGTDDEVGQMVNYTPGHVSDLEDEFGLYYSFLQDRDGFKIAHPQQGLSMKHLVPLVFEKYYNVGENVNNTNDLYRNLNGDPLVIGTPTAQAMRGRAHPMPRFNTTYLRPNTDAVANGMGAGTPQNRQTDMPDILPVYVAMILMPPSVRCLMYYRMRVTCHLSFEEIRPIQDITSFELLSSVYAPLVYHSDYGEQTKAFPNATDMVDTTADIQKIMEGR